MGFESVCFNFPDCSAVLLIFVSVLLQYSECGERERRRFAKTHQQQIHTIAHTLLLLQFWLSRWAQRKLYALDPRPGEQEKSLLVNILVPCF